MFLLLFILFNSHTHKHQTLCEEKKRQQILYNFYFFVYFFSYNILWKPKQQKWKKIRGIFFRRVPTDSDNDGDGDNERKNDGKGKPQEKGVRRRWRWRWRRRQRHNVYERVGGGFWFFLLACFPIFRCSPYILFYSTFVVRRSIEQLCITISIRLSYVFVVCVKKKFDVFDDSGYGTRRDEDERSRTVRYRYGFGFRFLWFFFFPLNVSFHIHRFFFSFSTIVEFDPNETTKEVVVVAVAAAATAVINGCVTYPTQSSVGIEVCAFSKLVLSFINDARKTTTEKDNPTHVQFSFFNQTQPTTDPCLQIRTSEISIWIFFLCVYVCAHAHDYDNTTKPHTLSQ